MDKIQLANDIYLYSKNTTPKKIVVFSHSLSDNHESDLIKSISTSLYNNGIGVVVYDFSFMKNKNQPSDNLLSEVDELGIVIAKAKEKLNPEEIILVGKSLGGIVSSVYYSRSIFSEISSIFIIGFPFKLGFPPKFKLLKEANPALPDYISEYEKLFGIITKPIFVIQGDRDDLGEIEECRKFFSKYTNCSLYVVNGANHGFVSPGDKNITYYDECSEFIFNKISS